MSKKMIRKFSVQLIKEPSSYYDIDNKINGSKDVAPLVKNVLNYHKWHNERLGMLCLDSNNKIIGVHIISEGTVNESPVFIREIATRALLNNAVSVILFHNHPSGNVNPSQADWTVTREAKKGLKILNINLLDHVILGDTEYTSLAEKGGF